MAPTGRLISRELTRLRQDGRAAVAWSLRITVAATLSYLVGTIAFPGTTPLLAPLTAMLVVQVTPVSLLATGLDRVIAVVVGVSVAVVFASLAPLEWWTLGPLIFLSISIGQVLRLRVFQVEVAISGMLVLGVGALGAQAAAWQRITETLVGAAVGVAANLLFPPKVAADDAGVAIDGLADRVSALLTRAADEVEERLDERGGREDVASAARTWLEEARDITHDMPEVIAALTRAEQGRRLNVRAVGTADVGPGLRQGLESLEHAAVTIRGMFRAVVDATHHAPWLSDDAAHDVLVGLAQTFRELAAGVDAFGQLVRDDADATRKMSQGDLEAMLAALDGLHEARTRLEDLLAFDVRPDRLELHAAVLSTVKRVLREMDLDERVRRQVRLLRPSRGRSLHRALPTHAEVPVIGEDSETQMLPVQPRGRRPRPRG